MEINVLQEIIKEQINILKQVKLFSDKVNDNLEFLFDRTVFENEQMESIEKSVRETITLVTDVDFWKWIEWFAYETEFGYRDDLQFIIDEVKYKPTLENIFEQCLDNKWYE